MEDNFNNEICDCLNIDKVNKIKEEALSEEMIYDMADFFKVFSDSTRLKILYTLWQTEMCVRDLVEAVDMTQSAVSHQLRVLRQNNLVKCKREGKAIIYSLDDEHVFEILNQGLSHLLHRGRFL